ncbi:pentapeptide repeat-containing protein [Mesobacterium pallidum]|uniref:pentapeptide repeat-containing protein n=1 Tax=Mesobacterium pallidum TaxID=2872037 RepID=UPI001EE2086F|nr:pentapeptide repeat-containing protein [Mesobacterium pallidum]
METTITLPIPPETFRALAALGVIALVTLVIGGLLALAGRMDKQQPSTLQKDLGMERFAPGLFRLFAGVWIVVAGILLFGLLGLIFDVLWYPMPDTPPSPIAQLWSNVTSDADSPEWNFRYRLAQIAALTTVLGAVIALPFTLIRVAHSARQTDATEQGLVTDRINKAVEGLGSEKTVSRIGRPVTILSGEVSPHIVEGLASPTFELPSASRETSRWQASEESENGEILATKWGISFETFEKTETQIEYQGEPFTPAPEVVVAEQGDWQVFSESVPNLEVRIGAIHALGRIARENLDFHVQIMQILCAYIRQNSPLESAQDLPDLPMPNGWEDSAAQTDWDEWRMSQRATLRQWAATLTPRADIQTALEVIGRRNHDQRDAEARAHGGNGSFVFAQPVPPFPDLPAEQTERRPALAEWKSQLASWRSTFRSYQGYRLDLRRCNLQGYDLSKLNLQGAYLGGAEMQGADLGRAEMQGAVLRVAEMQGADLGRAEIDSATDLSAATLRGAALRSVDCTSVPQISAHVPDMFGDASVTLPDDGGPDSTDWPPHWPKIDLDGWVEIDGERVFRFTHEWRKWQRSLETGKTYVPPTE